MERILVVSSTDKSHAMLAQFLVSCGVQSQLYRAKAGSEARRALVDGEFDLVLVNTPLPDEFGHELAQLAAGETTAGVILLAKAEIADSVAEKVEDDGVFVVPKPLSRVLFMQALRMTRAARSRLSGLQNENRRLQKRIEDIRLVDRAKCLLIECCGMSEPEAHSYIEPPLPQARRRARHHRWRHTLSCRKNGLFRQTESRIKRLFFMQKTRVHRSQVYPCCFSVYLRSSNRPVKSKVAK